MRFKNFVTFFMLFLLSSYCINLQAELPPERPTDAELALLPPYCHARIKGNDNARKLWQQRMGREGFLHMHHYCFGLNDLNRANMTFNDKNLRSYLINRGIGNFNYVLQHWPPDFPLRNQAQLYKNQLELMKNTR